MNKTTTPLKTLYFFLITLLFNFSLHAQTAGQITNASTSSPNYLDPNNDGWVTSSGSAFISDDQAESELSFIAIPQISVEPTGDAASGGTCGSTDIVDDSNGADGSYFLIKDIDGIANNGDELLIFRLRIGNNPGSGNFGFSVLIDSDLKMGTSDTNTIAGNPGFEYEIRVVNGGGSKGVYVDNINGTTNGTNVSQYGLATNSQRSYALLSNCGNLPIFYDFFVPLTDIGLTTTSNFRMVAATTTNGTSALGNNASDIGGTDDDDPSYINDDEILIATILAQGNGLNTDADNDGILDLVDEDDDNDGIADTKEGYNSNNPFGDEDGDGILNWLDVVDNGTGDGSTTNYADANNDGVPDVYDTDGDGIVNHLDLDSDNDGINDNIEAGFQSYDTNNDGIVNSSDAGYVDANSNGIVDDLESANPNDTDGDGILNHVDLDSDNDGINDLTENNNSSLDSNGDGIGEGSDTDGDGILDSFDDDLNNYGDLGSSSIVDTDGDGIANYIDLDSDDDGILDIVESNNDAADTNGDGFVDGNDTNGGDTDSDGIPDALDNDLNNFGDLTDQGTADDISDSTDPNSGGTGAAADSGTDADGDGIPNSIDNCDGITGVEKFGLCNSTLDIEEFDAQTFTIFPNPVYNNLNIILKSTSSKVYLTIYNYQGQQVYKTKKEVVNNRFKIALNNLNEGVYLLKLEKDNGISSFQKFIKLN